MIINRVIKIIGSCINGFARNCFCSQGLVMHICFVGLFMSSVSELRVAHFLQEKQDVKLGPKTQISLMFTDAVDQSVI